MHLVTKLHFNATHTPDLSARMSCDRLGRCVFAVSCTYTISQDPADEPEDQKRDE